MDSKRGWLKQSFGKRLNAIHSWNAWILLLLTVTGIVLSIGAIRGDLGSFRVTLKQLHIYLGVASILLIVLYAPMIRKHWHQIRARRNQRANLVFVLALLIGWAVSGVILWQFRHLPPALNNRHSSCMTCLPGSECRMPLYHAISRSRWLKRQQRLDQAAAADRRLRRRSQTPAAASAAAAAKAKPVATQTPRQSAQQRRRSSPR